MTGLGKFFGVADRAVNLTLGVAFLDGLAAVLGLATLGQGDLDFGPTFLKVHLERHDGQRLGLGLFENAVDFVAVQQELALAIWVVAPEAHRELPWRNVGLEQPHLAIIDAGVGLGDDGLAFAQGLHFGAREDHAALEGFEDVVVVTGAAIRGDDAVTIGIGLGFRPPFLHLLCACHPSSVPTLLATAPRHYAGVRADHHPFAT